MTTASPGAERGPDGSQRLAAGVALERVGVEHAVEVVGLVLQEISRASGGTLYTSKTAFDSNEVLLTAIFGKV